MKEQMNKECIKVHCLYEEKEEWKNKWKNKPRKPIVSNTM